MRGVTHAAAGLVVGVALKEATGDPTYWLPAAGVLGGLLPDMDEPNSTIAHLPGKARSLVRDTTGSGAAAALVNLIVSIVAGILEAGTVALATFVKSVLGHRGAMHSLALAVGVAAGATMGVLALGAVTQAKWEGAVPPLVGPVLGVGYVTHLVTDAMTKTGVPLLWPLTKERIRILPKWMAASTGGALDWFVGFACTAATLWLMIRSDFGF
jgi:membrane-bound metal-dependent hydrolase YbcI (DUF457 family)